MTQTNKDTSSNLAIVVVPIPPQDSTPPSNPDCAYQVEIAYHEYQCMTAQQYQDYKNPPVSSYNVPMNWSLFWLVYGVVVMLSISVFVIVKWRKNR